MEVNTTIPGPFHHLSLAIVLSFSTSPPSSHATRIHNIIYIHRPFIQKPVKLNIHIFEFSIVLGQYSYFYRLGETGCYNSLPLKGTSSSMFYMSMCSIYTEVNKKGYACLMASSISHVASSGPKCFHCTLSCEMVIFLSGVSFLSIMHWGSRNNSPFGST